MQSTIITLFASIVACVVVRCATICAHILKYYMHAFVNQKQLFDFQSCVRQRRAFLQNLLKQTMTSCPLNGRLCSSAFSLSPVTACFVP